MKKIFFRLPSNGKVYSAETDLDLKPDQEILVEVDQIVEGAVTIKDLPADAQDIQQSIAKIIRLITCEDRKQQQQLKNKARSFIDEAQTKAHRHGLDIKILDVELSFDERKMTFYFSSSERVDFRSLVSDLVHAYNKLIRLQQVGSRDEAKFFGGFGKCGRELCCAKFLNNLESITLEMAQAQDLNTAGSAKLSGSCGKLMCCLAFEAGVYQSLKEKMPKIGTDYVSTQGKGRVVGHNAIEGKVVLETEQGKRIEVSI